jgi:hypothetical protein
MGAFLRPFLGSGDQKVEYKYAAVEAKKDAPESAGSWTKEKRIGIFMMLASLAAIVGVFAVGYASPSSN